MKIAKPRPSVVYTLFVMGVSALLTQIMRTVFSFEIERHWDQTVLPWLENNVGSWFSAMAEYLGGFWGGVAVTLIVLLCFEAFFTITRRRGASYQNETESDLGSDVDPEGQKHRRELLVQLDDLFAVAVRSRNRVIPPIEDFDVEDERGRIRSWNDKVLKVLDALDVAVSLRSRIRTLDRFKGTWTPVPGKSEEQERTEAIWNQKITILRAILDVEGGKSRSS
jgi:hypothetical protein